MKLHASPHPLTIETVEMHTGGEPVRIVVAGYPPIPGATLLAKRRQARAHRCRDRRHRGRARKRRARPPDDPDLAGADSWTEQPRQHLRLRRPKSTRSPTGSVTARLARKRARSRPREGAGEGSNYPTHVRCRLLISLH